MTISYRSLAAFAILTMAISVSTPALAQNKQPDATPQPSPSAPGTNGNQAANTPAPSGAAPNNQGGAQPAPSNNQASNPPANNNSDSSQSATPAADHGVQTVTGDLVPGYDPIMMAHTETVTTRLELHEGDGTQPRTTDEYKLVQGIKDDGTHYAYIETQKGVRYPLREVAVRNGESSTTMFAVEEARDTSALVKTSLLVAVAPDAKPVKRVRNEAALIEVIHKQGGQPPPPPDQKKESPPQGQNRQGGQPAPGVGPASGRGTAKAAKAGALENDNNKSDKSNDNRETRTEREPAGHSSKPATAPTKLQQAVAATEAKQSEIALAKPHEMAPLAKFDTSQLGTSGTSRKPASVPASTLQAGKLTAFDTSHMGSVPKLQLLSKPALLIPARTLANQR